MLITLRRKPDQPFITPEMGDEFFANPSDEHPMIVLVVQVQYDEDDKPVSALIWGQ